MGHSKAEKAETHKRIVGIASKRFRESGLSGIGVADLMKEAGLTVGGFYKHFDSRDDLVAEAVGSAVGGWNRKVEGAAAAGTPPAYADVVDRYLSEAHRDNPGAGCAISALAAELARSDERTRSLATEEIRHGVDLLAGLVPDPDKDAARAKALLAYSALTGALALSRVVTDEEFSREILKTVAGLLKSVGEPGHKG